MFEGLSNEIIARTAATYLAETIIALVVAVAFVYFSYVYRRRFMKTWAWSFGFFSMAALSLGFSALYGYNKNDGIRLVASFLSQCGIFLHAFFLIIGLQEIIRKKSFKRSFIIGTAALIAGISFVTIWAYYDTPGTEGSLNRYMLRVGLRYFVIAVSFLAAGIMAMRSPVFTRGIGQRILVISFFLYGLTYSYYFSVAVFNYLGHAFRFPFFFGMVELVLITLAGLGMVVWLLEDERERLNKLNKELDSFMYSTSHDLRSPIASILGITNVARLELTDETTLRYMGMIEERIKRLDSVITDILKLSRSKKLDLKIETIDFNNLLKDTIADVKFNQNAPSIELDYVADPGNIFSSDYAQMKIILGNLISNAVKYHNIHQPKPIIRVAFKRTGRNVEIIVEDNGRGIQKEALPRIFEMFYRAETKVEGTGLGLYIVKEALLKINGSISVVSEYGQGTTFIITLANA